jgi:hypothetical protein
VLVRRIPQLILVTVAGYELRSLVGSVARAVSLYSAGASTGRIWGALLALALGVVLLQVARGLTRVMTVPRWVLWLLGAWCVVASALLVQMSADGMLSGHGAPALALGRDGPWLDVLALAGFGAAVSVSGRAHRWFWRRPLALVFVPARDLTQLWADRIVHPMGAPPLLAGWSDRGPPSGLTPQAI